MENRIFVSHHNEGWKEIALPVEYRKCSYERLVRNVHQILNRNKYKGLLITQNPAPFLIK